MAAFPSSALADFFSRMGDQGGVIVRETPKFDLDLYIQNYKGRTRFERLLLIGKCCVPLSVGALKAAVAEAKQGTDVSRYKEAWDCIRIAAPAEPEATRDEQWITKTEHVNKAETNHLEGLLKGYKNNLIKESIRMGNEDLGGHFESCGRLNDAAEAYSRMRQDVSTTKHIVDCGLHLAMVSLQRRDWTMALNNVSKISGVQSDGDEDLGAQASTKIIAGIAYLGLSRLDDAARAFIQTPCFTPAADYSHIASPNDVAVYGGLLALATMDRHDLQTKVMESQSFRHFLEYEPNIRKAINLFINGRYSSCLSILESVRNDYLLDIHLQKDVSTVYSRIRSKCIVQYFVPFSCVTIKSLGDAFASPGRSIEDELVGMIRSGALRARIDAKNELLIAVRSDARLEMQKQALEVARKYEQGATERLRRISILAAGLENQGTRKQAAAEASGLEGLVSRRQATAESSVVDDGWHDESQGYSRSVHVSS